MLNYQMVGICIQISAKCPYKISYWSSLITINNQDLIMFIQNLLKSIINFITENQDQIRIYIWIQKLENGTPIIKIKIIRSKYKIKI